jgi:prepilin-type N-terminal cleavage/methylation domain-containing protein
MKRRSESGFTLIEVLVAFAILSLTIIVGFQIFLSGLNRINAAEIANERLSQAKVLLHQVQMPSDPDARPPTGQDFRITKTLVVAEKIEWTNVRPALIQVRDGNEIILETIILTHDNL